MKQADAILNLNCQQKHKGVNENDELSVNPLFKY